MVKDSWTIAHTGVYPASFTHTAKDKMNARCVRK